MKEPLQAFALFIISAQIFSAISVSAAGAGSIPVPGLPGSSFPSQGPSTAAPSTAPATPTQMSTPVQPLTPSAPPLSNSPDTSQSPSVQQAATSPSTGAASTLGAQTNGTASTFPPLRGMDSASSTTVTNGANSIDQFFQLPKTNSRQAPPPTPELNANADKHSHGLGRTVYKVLDNIGVPLPYNKQRDLDPSISDPPPGFGSVVKRLQDVNAPGNLESTATVPQVPTTFQAAPKIPKSELEGVELPTPSDAPTTK